MGTCKSALADCNLWIRGPPFPVENKRGAVAMLHGGGRRKSGLTQPTQGVRMPCLPQGISSAQRAKAIARSTRRAVSYGLGSQ